MTASKKNTGHFLSEDDPPELDDTFFQRAEIREGDKLVRRGRPPVAEPKAPVTLRLDADIATYFRGSGRGWQTRINAILRRSMQRAAR